MTTKIQIDFRQTMTGIFLCLILGTACKEQKVSTPNAEINTAFESVPPLAEDITIKVLEKPTDIGNVLVTARLDPKVIKNKYHAVMVSDEKLILRDDGEGGDEKAGDGVFSIIVKEDMAQFRKSLMNVQTVGRQFESTKRNIFKWVNRSAVPITQKLRIFNASKFDTAKIIKIDPDVLFAATPDPVLNDHSLMVTSLGVVEDPTRTFNPCSHAGNPNGTWTFGKLITDMANTPVTGVSGENFVKSWLDSWMNDQTINGDVVAARTGIFNTIIVPWIIKSNPGISSTSITIANWKTKLIQLKFAPFKLIAIVNRVDLRGNSGYTISNAGEGRFVFGALTATCATVQLPGKFTVIFEYGVPKKTCGTLKAYAQQWINLKTLTPGTPAYNAALEAITTQFTAAGAGGTKPNGSSLNQIRTNELALGGAEWELREFNILATTHLLGEVTVKQEPAKIYNRLANPPAFGLNLHRLADYVNTNQASILNNTYSIPLTFAGLEFLGGKAHTETPGHFWDASTSNAPGSARIFNNDARHIISINTCSGCHGGEGKTSVGNLIHDPVSVAHNSFLQIAPQAIGVKATLSAFLTGDPAQPDGLFMVTDPSGRPAGAPSIWSFNDLARRNVDLQQLAMKTCQNTLTDLLLVLKFKPVHMTH